MSNKRIWMTLPDRDFDVTETAVPWKLLTRAGHEVVFATEKGATAAADPLLLSGVVFGKLGARPEPKAFYAEMIESAAFRSPRTWDELTPDSADALILPGGHAQGMRQFLDSAALQARIAAIFAAERPVAAICHGVLAAARATDPATGRSILHGRKTTCLPKYMERSAWLATFWKVGRYFRTYPSYVEDEVKQSLASPSDFQLGPRVLFRRGTDDDDRGAFAVEDGLYVSARWPGDAYLFARKLLDRL